MHLLWKRMERLVEELRQNRHMTADEKYSAIMLALEVSGIKRTPAEAEWIRKCVDGLEAADQERRKKL